MACAFGPLVHRYDLYVAQRALWQCVLRRRKSSKPPAPATKPLPQSHEVCVYSGATNLIAEDACGSLFVSKSSFVKKNRDDEFCFFMSKPTFSEPLVAPMICARWARPGTTNQVTKDEPTSTNAGHEQHVSKPTVNTQHEHIGRLGTMAWTMDDGRTTTQGKGREGREGEQRCRNAESALRANRQTH